MSIHDGSTLLAIRKTPSLRQIKAISVDVVNYMKEEMPRYQSVGRPSDEELERWLERGDVDRLEQLVLEGQGGALQGKSSSQIKSRSFLKSLKTYMNAVDGFLRGVIEGNLENVKEFSAYKKVLFARHPNTSTHSLHLAVIFTQLDVLRFLLLRRGGVQLINSQDKENRTPLHYAAIISGFSQNVTFYDLLKSNGAEESIIDSEGYLPPQYVKYNQLIKMDDLRKLNNYPVKEKDKVDEMIENNRVIELENMILDGDHWILENRTFPIRSRDIERRLSALKNRIEAIHDAVREGHFPYVKQLVDRKSFAVAKYPSGATPLHTAVLHKQLEITEYLLLVFPHSVEQTDRSGRTALHYAACLSEDYQTKFYQLLLSSGADRQHPDELGNSPDYYKDEPKRAAQVRSSLGRSASQKELINRQKTMDNTSSSSSSTKITEKDVRRCLEKNDYTLLERLMARGKEWYVEQWAKKYTEVAKFLESYRANQGKMQQLQEAIDNGNLRKVKSIMDKKKLSEAQDHMGNSALHMAVKAQKMEIAEYLTKKFPSCVKITDKVGRTPLHFAAAIPDKSIYEMLVENGAKQKAVDKDGNKPIDILDNPELLRHSADQAVSSRASQGSSIDIDIDAEQEIDEAGAPTDFEIADWLAEGDIECLEQMVLDGRGYLLQDKSSQNPTSVEFLRALSQYQAKIDAIHKAVEEGDVRRVKSLIDRSQLSVSRDRKGMTPLHKAVLHGQTDTIRFLLTRFPQTVNILDHNGRTALHYAAADRNGGHYIKILQKAGGDAFIEDKFGHTPFYYRTNPDQLNLKVIKDNAVMDQLMAGELSRPLLQDLEEDIIDWLQTGNIGKLEELVLNGYGDLLLGRTHDVEDKDIIDFLEILPQYQAKIAAIHRAVQNGDLRGLRMLADRKKLAFVRDTKGATPLHNAIIHDQMETAKYLLRNYPQAVNAQDHNKRTPLHFAAASQDGGVMYKTLRKAGADPDILDCLGRAPKYYLNHPGELDVNSLRMDTKTALKQVLHNRIAPSYLESSIQQWLREGNVAKLEQLVLSGCGDLLLDKEGGNPEAEDFLNGLNDYLEKIDNIHRAVRDGNLRQFKELVDRRKLAMARDRKGATPLHDAIVYGQTDVLRYIIQSYGHVLNCPDYNKRTPLHYAAAARDGGHYYKILEKAGADPKAVDNEGHTPDYYRRNLGIMDLKQIRDRDADSVADLRDIAHNSQMLDEEEDRAIMMASRASDMEEMVSEIATPVSQIADGEIDQMMESAGLEASRHAFEQALTERISEAELQLNDRRSMPSTENGLYLARTVGPVLTKALAEVVIKRPADPIDYISNWLYRYHEEMQRSSDSGVGNSTGKSKLHNGVAE